MIRQRTDSGCWRRTWLLVGRVLLALWLPAWPAHAADGAAGAAPSQVPVQQPAVDTPSTPSAVPGEPPATVRQGESTEETAAVPPVAEIGSGNEVSATSGPPPVTAEEVQELAKQAREGALPDELKTELAKRFQTALEWLQGSDDAQRKIGQFEQEMQEGTDRIVKAQAALSQSAPDLTLLDHADKSLAERETLLGEAKARLEQASVRLAERETELKNRAERKAELQKKLDDIRVRQEELEQQRQLAAPNGEAVELTAARRVEMESRQRYLKAHAELYQAEMRRNEKLAELFPLLRDLAKRDTNLVAKEVAHLQNLVDEARRQESERQAVEARRRAELADPAIRDLAEHNATLADKRKEVAEKITRVSAEIQEINERLSRLNGDFQRARERVAKAGHSTIVGLVLRRHHDALPSLKRSQERLNLIDRETPVLSFELLEFEEERATLADLGAMRDQIMQKLDEDLNLQHGEHLQQTVHEQLTSQRELLDKVIGELNAYLAAMSELEATHRDLITAADDFRAFIDEHVLWIRSADPLRVDDLSRAATGIQQLARPAEWLQLARDTAAEILRRPVTAAFILGVATGLLAYQRRLRRSVRQLCGLRVNSQGWHFQPALHALALTALTTLHGPLLIWFLGWQMTHATLPSDLGLALGPALRYAAVLAWLNAFLRALCRRDGVAETFFDWPRASLDLARRSLRWLTASGLPLSVLVIITHQYAQAEWSNSLGRIAFLLVMMTLVIFVHRVLRAKENIFSQAISDDPKSWLQRVRLLAYLVGGSVPVCLAALASVGYYYSAQQLAVRLQASFGAALLALLVHAVASRWFVVKGRRFALQQARERQLQTTREILEQASGKVTAPPGTPADWNEVHGRLQVLLRQAISVGVLVASWLIWSDVLPALRILDRVVLWSQTVDVVQVIEAADGRKVSETTLQEFPTTLRHGLLAVVFFGGAIILGRNLPLLLQITILNRLPLDRGGRHAVSVVLHYALALTGTIAAFRTLNINWGSIQWLAAGMTVGLGFGLQEIFANFVSGIILLFERPIRVGDVITLDEVSGTVTDIRARATTVTNWDRKELIVPNKDLVTGRLLNWTLSDTTNRVVIKIGLGYQTDVPQARALLLETVASHPNVLEQPAPTVVLDSFGDSSLNFVIRVHLATLDVRLETVHDLHAAIHQRLQEAGMEIPFPQRDLNIRHWELPSSWATTDQRPAVRRNEAA